MKVLITGTNGYIGKSLVTAFKDKYEVTALTRKEVDLTSVIDVIGYFKGKYFDVVIHCAVKGGSRLVQDDWNVLDTNLRMYYNLLECRGSYGKLLHFGSGAEDYMPDSAYGLSKKVIAKSISEIEGTYNLRIYGVFDENELDTRFIKANIKRYLSHQPMQIYQDKSMDFFYMGDLVKIVEEYISGRVEQKTYMCSYTEKRTLLDIAQYINTFEDYSVPVSITNIGIGVPYAYPKVNLLEIEETFTGLYEGIRIVYEKLKNEAN